MKRSIAVMSALLITLATTPARAHAFLDRAEPRVGSAVPSAPHQVTLWFTQNLEPAFSGAAVNDSSGARVDQGKARFEANVMRISLKPLPAGTYTVHWRVLSVDTHTTEGSFSFHVGSQ